MKQLLLSISLALMLLPVSMYAQEVPNPCTSDSKASNFNQFFNTVFNGDVSFTVGTRLAECVTVKGITPASLSISNVQSPPGAEGTIAFVTVFLRESSVAFTYEVSPSDEFVEIPLIPGRFGIVVDFVAEGSFTLIYDRNTANPNNALVTSNVSIVADVAAPVTWTKELSYREAGNRVALHWSVAQQVDVSGFELEADYGNGFQSVAPVAYQENGLLEVDYSVEQDWPVNGAYYRVKQNDYAGTFSYSNIIYVPGAASASQLTLFPNPATNFVRMAVPESASAVAVYQANGQQVGTYTVEQARQGIDLQQLPRGLYLVRALGTLQPSAQRLVVQH